MGKIEIATKFITMVKVLFANVEVAINLNGKMTKTFEIRRRVKQGCLIAPYLFFIIGEVLNVMVKSHSTCP
jgi:hypothetical protein